MIFDKNYITSALLPLHPRTMALFPGHLSRFSPPCIPGGKKKQRGLGNCCYGTASAAYEGLPIPKQNCGQAALLQEAAGAGRLFQLPSSPAAEMDTGNGIAVSRAPV